MKDEKIIKKYQGNVVKIYVFLRHILLSPKLLEKYIPKEGKIIDLGCGFGSYDIYFGMKSKKRKIYGFELNEKRIIAAKKASKELQNVKFYVQDFNCNRKIDNCSCIIMNDVLHHVNKNIQDELISSAEKKISKKGCLIIKDVWETPGWKYYYCYLHDFLMTLGKPTYFIKKEEMIRKIKKAGFKKIEIKNIDTFFLNPIPHIIYICKK